MSTDCAALDIPTGNVQPVLHEIAHALRRWLETKSAHVIDLRAMPMAPKEITELIEILGTGEITAQLNALGESEIVETRFPGVWLITHFHENRSVSARSIEITDMPALLKSQQEDVAFGLNQLEETLEERP